MPDSSQSGSAVAQSSEHPQHKRPRTRRSRGRRYKTYAALDLGTNNCRLLIARKTENGFRVIDSYSRSVRLGAGLATTGRLADDNIKAAIDALTVCSRKLHARKVKRWRCVATQACRQAENGEEFMRQVKAQTGLRLEIISPRVEAKLAVMGCLNLIDTSKDVALVVDIGGGSTELSWVDVRKLKKMAEKGPVHKPPISAWASLPVGVVTLSEMVPEHDDRDTWYADMKAKVCDAIEQAGCSTRFTNHFKGGRGHIIGTSGTITSLAGIYQKLPCYQRDKVDGSWMPSAEAVRIARRMASLPVKERAKEPCIGHERANLLVAGCAITDVVCELWPCSDIRVGDRGLREGLLMGLMQQSQILSTPPKRPYSEPCNDG